MADWIVSSKLAPSHLSRSHFPREHLVATLDSALRCRAAVVHAPAGFGKSSLLAQWHRSLEDREIPAAWLSLDNHDQEPFQFLTYLMEACKTAGVIGDTRLPLSPDSVSSSLPAAFVAALLTEFAKTTVDSVLILDDFHRAASPEVCRAVERLVAQIPANWHVVLSAREVSRRAIAGRPARPRGVGGNRSCWAQVLGRRNSLLD